MASVPQIASLRPFRKTTQLLFSGTHTSLSNHLRRTVPDILTSLSGWSSAEIIHPFPPQRWYSMGPLGIAHQGLTLPYPQSASLDASLFEPITRERDLLSPSLPSLIHQQRYSEAARVRSMLVDAGLPIEPSWEYEKMAFRMLIPSLNPLNKARVNSFHVWWSLVPEQRQSGESVTAAVSRRRYLHRIITWLCRLDTPDCPINALIRFGIAAASKGYAPDVADRLLPHIVLWAHPALSANFLIDFIKAHERYVGASSQSQHWLIEAIETQMSSGRDKTAVDLLVKTCQDAGLHIPPHNLPTRPLDHHAHCEDGGQEQPSRRTATIPSSSREWPTMSLDAGERNRGSVSGISHRDVREQFSPRNLGSRQMTLQLQRDRHTLSQVARLLRTCNDPSAAFLHFKSSFETLNVIPTPLNHMLDTLVSRPSTAKGKGKSKSEEWPRIANSPTHRRNLRRRRWPSAYGTSLLWQIAISARKTLATDFDALYGLFLQHLYQRMLSLDWQRMYKDWNLDDMRRINSKVTGRAGRINLYTPWCPPKYGPSVYEFNAFLWGCTGNKDLTGAGSVMPSIALAKVEHILRDMETVGVQPDRYSLGQLAKACAAAGCWRKLVATLDQMHQAGMLKQDRLTNTSKRRAHEVVVEGWSSTQTFLQGLASRLEGAGLQRRSKLVRRWAEEGKYD